MLDGHTINGLHAEPQLARVQHRQCGRYWAVIRTHPQAERWACDNLARRGFNAYLPLTVVRVRDRHTPSIRNVVEQPLFTRYAFVTIDGHWTPIRYCPGVAALLMTDGKPNAVAKGAVEALQATNELRRHLPAPNAQWAPGTPCGLANGLPLSGLPAVVTELRGHQVNVAIMFLGQLRHIRVHASQLVPRAEP